MATKKKKAAKRPAKKTAKKAAKRPAKKTAKKAAKRPAKKAAKKAAKRPAKKTAKKAAKRPAKKKAKKRKGEDNELILVAVRGMVLFPGVVLPIAIGRPASVRAVQAAVQSGRKVGVVLQSNPEADTPTKKDLHKVGTLIEILRYVTAPDGTHHVVAQGAGRFRIDEFTSHTPYFTAKVTPILEQDPAGMEVEERRDLQARFLALKTQAHEALALLPQAPDDLDNAIENTPTPGVLADLVATFMDISPDEKQALLETADLKQRLTSVSTKLAELTAVLQMSSDIRESTKGNLDKAQREYFLREQLRTIQQELGEGSSMEVAELGDRIDAAGMPEEVLAAARKELTRLERIPEASAEYSMVRTYLDWMLDLPWSVSSDDRIDLRQAEEILDEDHYGLEKVKKRILEFLAVRRLKPDGKSPILCLAGPPGTGKTSLGRSIARAMGRKFTRVSLGGVHDEAEIRGHRRTYVGAMPGNVIQGLRSAGVNNPVFLFDEMDKLGQGFHGDPASALLEVLDPAQNKTFEDHYLDVPFDLSRVLFLATANYLDNIPGPLRDRMEVIELSSYTEAEKIQIARRYLLPRQTAENGLTNAVFQLTDPALVEIVRHYTMEAGCRNLERELGSVARHVATLVARHLDEVLPPEPEPESAEDTPLPELAPGSFVPGGAKDLSSLLAEAPGTPLELIGDADGSPADAQSAPPKPPRPTPLERAIELELELPKHVIGKGDLHRILGPTKYESDVALRTAEPGVATGLAWTPVGGVILFVEATRMPGKGNLILTGQLGDVMQESATAAMSLLKTRADRFGLTQEDFEKVDIHVHLPEGATPKDGPSAGVTLFTTLVSLMTGRRVRSDLAMTGEINLRGLVLPVGGIKEKVLAAYRAGLRRVILPKRNEKDLEDVPESVRSKIEFHCVTRVGEVLDLALCDEVEACGS
ncbi:MAG: endopeptidase La [Planctomycetota bacterium]|nr:endopeptidase La [Planctomycetota bacterium]